MRDIYHYFKFYMMFIYQKILSIRYGKPKVEDSYNTIVHILESKKSVCRYGDGEFSLMLGESIKFQDYDECLSQKLKEILENPKDMIVCIPAVYDLKILKSLKYTSQLFWLQYNIAHYKDLSKLIPLKRTYYDACVTRPYIRYRYNHKISKVLFPKIKMIWDQQDILIVEGEFSRLGVGNDLFDNAKSIKRILCPSKNAYRCYEKIKKAVQKHADHRLVLISLGPTATALAYDLDSMGIRSIDLGHLDLEYEWYLQKAKDKTDIENKAVNEVSGEKEFSEVRDVSYQQSILEVIK